ncbi:MAG: LacI family DNA-binding transcriptional regulator [Candidatus Methylacidiphilales bacterium]|nr:LacI family DNA-binding transcriptional regulator [Candidatus Methylacidiphilales bacterium]
MKNPVRSTRQLAEALGLSRWTVSRALNGHKGIHPDTIERIRQAARKSGFAPSALGRSLRSGKTELVGVCVPDLVDYFLSDKVMQLQKAISARGLDVLLQISNGTPEGEQAALERFAALHCQSVVVVAPCLAPQAPAFRHLENAGIPVVHIDSLTPGRGRQVETDRKAGLQRVAEHLHALGHRRLATVAIRPDSAYGRQRLEGLRLGARKGGASDASRIFHWPAPPETGTWAEFARHPVTALVALNDRIALRLLHWADREGLQVPRDLSIVGYDNAEIAAYSRPALTTVDPHASLLIEEAVRLLDHDKPTRVRVRPELVVRESTGPAPKKKRK